MSATSLAEVLCIMDAGDWSQNIYCRHKIINTKFLYKIIKKKREANACNRIEIIVFAAISFLFYILC